MTLDNNSCSSIVFFSLKMFDPYEHFAECCIPLITSDTRCSFEGLSLKIYAI